MTVLSTLSVPLTTLADLFGQVFADYLVPISADPVAFAARIRQEQIDLAASLVVRALDDELVGLALIARRGDTSRLAGMGVKASWRGKNLGQKLMGYALKEAQARGDRRMVLEVIEQNLAAVRLYERSGFATMRRLVGYEASQLDSLSGPLEEASIAEYADSVARYGELGLPWQLTSATACGVTLPSTAFRSGEALVLLVVTPEIITVRGIVVYPSARRKGHARRLLGRLAARFPARRWVVPAVVPELLAAEFFLSNGFRQTTISQREMVCDLAATQPMSAR